VALCGGVLTYELLPVPYPVTRWQISPFFYQLARDRDEYAVVNIPMSDLEPMMMEPAIHHKAVFDGHLARVPLNAYRLLSTNAFLQYCTVSSARGPMFAVNKTRLSPRYLRPALAQLGHIGARYVILHKHWCEDVPGTEQMLTRLGLPVVWDDSIIRAYRIPR
jgi:hypothetical protein